MKRISLLLCALGLAIGFNVASGSPASAGVGTTCHNAVYPDGKVVYRACVAWDDPSGSAWYSQHEYAWNPTTASGGHTDIVGNPMEATGYGWNDTIDQLDDGETQTVHDDTETESTNTVWFCAETTYDAYAYRVFIRPGTATHDRYLGNCP